MNNIRYINGRILQKHDISENWNKVNSTFIPGPGEIIVYDDYKTIFDASGNISYIPGIKIGTGNAYLGDLKFLGEDEISIILAHIDDDNTHTSMAEKEKWNNKLNIEESEILDETLIFKNN